MTNLDLDKVEQNLVLMRLEKYTTDSMDKIPKSIEASDFRKEGVVTSLGSVALHLLMSSPADEYQTKIMDILGMLHKLLHTPSEDEVIYEAYLKYP